MTERDTSQDEEQAPDSPAGDDRRGDVRPTDNPRPSSPEPDEDAVRAGEENLDRVKPY